MKRGYFMYIAALCLFGSNGVVALNIALESYQIVMLRTLIASVFLCLAYFVSGGRMRALEYKKDMACIAVSGAAMGISWIFLFEAYVLAGVSIPTLAYYCGPVIVMALSPFIFGEKITIFKIAGLGSVAAGMLLVNGAELHSGGISRGLFYGLAAALMYSFMVIFNKKAKNVTGLENSAMQMCVACAVSTVYAVGKGLPSIAGVIEFAVPVMFLGLINTGVGCYLYFTSIQKLPAASVAVCGYLEPLSALLFSAVMLNEKLSYAQLLGAALIIGGAAMGELLGAGLKNRR